MCSCPVFECPMKLVLVFLLVFCGHVRYVASSTTVMLGPTFDNLNDLKTRLNEEKRMIQHVIAFIHKKEEMLNMRLHELNYRKVMETAAYPTIKKDEIEQSLVVVKTKTTTERGKRFIPRGPSLTPCLLKICTMGKKIHYMRH